MRIALEERTLTSGAVRAGGGARVAETAEHPGDIDERGTERPAVLERPRRFPLEVENLDIVGLYGTGFGVDVRGEQDLPQMVIPVDALRHEVRGERLGGPFGESFGGEFLEGGNLGQDVFHERAVVARGVGI